jgi:hypothetical protein
VTVLLDYIAYAFVVCFVGLPALLLVHELGHAAVVLLLTRQRVVVRLGRPPALLRVACGRLEFQLRPLDGSGFYHILGWQRTTPRQRAWAALGGPAATLLVMATAGSLAALGRPSPGPAYFLSSGIAFLALLQLVLTVPPLRYPRWWGDYAGTNSDGYTFWQFWASRGQEPPALPR